MNKPIRAGNSAIAIEVEEGKSYFWCSCGKSLKQPLCDGSHKETEFKSSYETNAASLMAPTKLYFPFLKKILTTNLINGISHITGGGIIGNAPRMLSENLSARIDKKFICDEEIFQWFQSLANISDEEMLKTFNCGLGLIMTISKNNYKEFEQLIKDENLDIFEIGKIEVNKSSRCIIS